MSAYGIRDIEEPQSKVRFWVPFGPQRDVLNLVT
jgi:hypothetical protein